jgi:site-specific recombinase XerD
LATPLGIQASTKASQLPAAILKANRVPQLAIVPLEHLLLPVELDGSSGINRCQPGCMLAKNDIEAIEAWLNLKPAESSTWRSYRKEAERFLLWAVIECRRPLSSLTTEDCLAYRDFMRRIDKHTVSEWPFRLPATHWCGTRGTKRWSALWRPFEGALSVESQNLAITILSSMCRWLVAQGYLLTNPWENVPRWSISNGEPSCTRGFSNSHWNLLLNYLESLTSNAKSERLRFVLSLCRGTDMRVSELIHAKLEHIQPYPFNSAQDGQCFLHTVTGRKIPLPFSVLSNLDRYLSHRGISTFQACKGSTYLITRLPHGRKAIPAEQSTGPDLSANALYQMLKQFFQEAADSLESQFADPAIKMSDHAMQIRRASTDWLRRTYDVSDITQ